MYLINIIVSAEDAQDLELKTLKSELSTLKANLSTLQDQNESTKKENQELETLLKVALSKLYPEKSLTINNQNSDKNLEEYLAKL